MDKTYIEHREGGYWVAGTRVSLDSIVYAFKRGAAPETIKRSFPVLSLEEIYGSITFYLAHEQEIDAYLAAMEAELDSKGKQLNAVARKARPDLFKRLDKSREDAVRGETLSVRLKARSLRAHARSSLACISCRR